MGLSGKTLYFCILSAIATFFAIKLYEFISRDSPVRTDKKWIEVVSLPQSQVRGKSTDTILKKDYKQIMKDYLNEKHKAVQNATVWNNVKHMLFFFGHGRSGTTIVSALLDAHPNIIMCPEYDVFGRWIHWDEKQRTRDYLFQELYSCSFEYARIGPRAPPETCRRPSCGFHVPHQWQGKFDKVIKIIGDKKAEMLLEHVVTEPKTSEENDVLLSIQKAVKVPIKFIYIIRNPFDIAATRMYHKTNMGVKDRNTLYKNPLAYNKKLQKEVVDTLAKLVKAAIAFTKRSDVDTILIYSEDIILDPTKELQKICEFLEVSCSEDYLRDCSSIIFKSPHETRNTIKWDEDAKSVINKIIQGEPLFQRYKFDT